ncbi:PhzF family phenazine biosynthesis protein [Gorillibacterium sp. sgz5001074]|uniref:PhzF family phenazine biosynthesis protein n=1 Tax=Gorillibacterium sp. sgz5001074 TaxID=3446695 RepID=UPI003F6728EA
MGQLKYYTVDVFAEKRYEGNQLAVFTGAGQLSPEEMLQIAREMNYSETTFILSEEPRNGGYDVRIFTPGGEVPFAGHPSLGTAYVIREFLLGQPVEQVVLNLEVGPIPVEFGTDGMQWMKQNLPEFGPVFDPGTMAEVLGLAAGDLDERYTVQRVSTGLPSILVPLKGLAQVRKARTRSEPYEAFIREHGNHTILLFSAETYKPDNQLNARSFCDCVGVPEDPATGSAAGNLSAYLVRHRYFGSTDIDVRMEQGYEIGRPSLLHLRASELADGSIRVRVGGRTVPVARGEWL